MKYMGMPLGMWLLYRQSFREHLVSVLGYSSREAQEITEKAKPRYREFIERLPEFEKGDRFQMNIVNCALLCALRAGGRPMAVPTTQDGGECGFAGVAPTVSRLAGDRRRHLPPRGRQGSEELSFCCGTDGRAYRAGGG